MAKNNYNVLGVMSGTSLDGIDLAHLSFSFEEKWNYEINRAQTMPYSDKWKEKLASGIKLDEDNLHQLDQEYTYFLGACINEFLNRHQISELDAICSHGHTIKHEPDKGFTVQIGNLPELARITGHKVVCDFRVQDVALGGQGAPLVPVGDHLLFSDFDQCLNLGGFANISLQKENTRVAFDICPVNTVLNHLSEKLGFSYDKDGALAREGALNEKLLQQLNDLRFYELQPPKCLGSEWVRDFIMPLVDEIEPSSALKTFCIHVSEQIAAVLSGKGNSVLVTGGGAFNKYLIEEIRERSTCKVVLPTPDIINYKEALIFGFLGVLKLRGEINVLSAVTGALRDHSSGFIHEP